METHTRQQLYDLVRSQPMRDAAKKLGLSDNGLRKHCVKVFVPLPPQGYILEQGACGAEGSRLSRFRPDRRECRMPSRLVNGTIANTTST
jgi:hypothetical protein